MLLVLDGSQGIDMRMTLRQLAVFVAVAQEGTVTRASEAVQLTQSAASMALADLEDALDSPLFDRLGKRLQLNDLGRYLLPQALETLSQRHPAIDVQVAVLTSQETLKKLAEGSLEIGLVALPQTPVKELRIEPWRRDPVMAFLPAKEAPTTAAMPAISSVSASCRARNGVCSRRQTISSGR